LAISVDELDARGAGADDAHALAGQVHALCRPSAGVAPVALEAVQALEVRYVVCRETTHRRDQETGARPVTIRQLDLPEVFAFEIDRRGHARVEPNVSAQIELVRHIVEITFVFRLTLIMFLPVPFLQKFF
jgi:hypothetical protein